MEYLIHIVIIAGIYAILSLSLNLIIGYTGLPAFGHAAFYCVGAYTSALLAINFDISPWIGLWVGAIAAALLGVLVSFPAIKLKGDYLALATFGSGVIVYGIASNWVGVTRGFSGLTGIPPFSILGRPFSTVSAKWAYLLLVLGFVALTYLVLHRIVNSPFGRILKGIREDETAALAIGHDINYYKIVVLSVGGLLAGMAGSLYAHYSTFINPSSFTVTESITILLMVVFGGMGSLSGSLIGAVSLILLPEALRFLGMPSSIAAPVRQMLYGGLLVVLMLKRPQGILGNYRFK